MKLLSILVIFVILLGPITAFAQQPMNEIIIEPLPDSTDISVTIDGELDNDGRVVLKIYGIFGSDPNEQRMLTSTTFTKDNPSYVFELDYPFLTNEVYSVEAINGYNTQPMNWIPLFSTQEVQTSTSEVLQFEMGQIHSTSVQVSDDAAGLFVSLRDENNLLTQTIEKKDAVLMEQVKVIQDLATKISKVKYTNSVDFAVLTVAQIEQNASLETFEGYLQTLSEENNLLTQTIEKKDAVIMEQLKVIQDLAEKIRNVSIDSTSSNFSLV